MGAFYVKKQKQNKTKTGRNKWELFIWKQRQKEVETNGSFLCEKKVETNGSLLCEN